MPYATCIIPTHDRSSTLGAAIASLQSQSVPDLEILVALDGASEGCRDIALRAASADARVRVLEFPKSASNGIESVHQAVLAARSDRIFYNDDDDLWLPGHVATLGPMLDDADVADTRVASLGPAGGLHLAACPPSAPAMRSLLAARRHKSVFDTHLAHRRDVYGRIAGWVVPGSGRKDTVWQFVGQFAADPHCRWRSSPAVTAVSLHGAARRHLPPAARAAEIRALAVTLADAAGRGRLLGAASPLFHLSLLLASDPPGAGGAAGYLDSRAAYEDVAGHPGAADLVALASGVAIDPDRAALLLPQLLETVLAGHLHHAVAGLLVRAFGAVRATAIAAAAAAHAGRSAAGCFATLALLLRDTDPVRARDCLGRALAAGPDPLGQLHQWREELDSQVHAQPGAGATGRDPSPCRPAPL